MAKMPPKKSGESTGDWLNTYADMVTLLLTFFVLLFACSNLDETKLQYIYQAFQSRGKYVNNVVADLDPAASSTGGVTDDKPDGTGGEGKMPQSFDELYVYLADYIDKNNLADKVAVEKGAAHLTIRFDDSVFFDGGSYILKPEGRELLDGIIPALKSTQKFIRTLTVAGHTADDGTDKTGDFLLSANRANSVYLHFKNRDTVDFSKYRMKASGPNEPVAPNDSIENMAKNRRVEVMILRDELDLSDPDVIQDILKFDYNLPTAEFDPDGQGNKDPSTLPEGSADRIISAIKDRYKDNIGSGGNSLSPGIIDSSEFVVSAESDSESTSA
ncbi:MAG TPA: flagellar motor protein [Ruminococcaceae bacterium]|nr:flagellar motor protein [Oscillospiraceae bacterium]